MTTPLRIVALATRRAAPAALAALLACGLGVSAAGAQAPNRVKLSTGTFVSGSGSMSGAAHVLLLESGIATRSSGEATDLIGGLIGRTYDPRTFAIYRTQAVTFASIAFPLMPPDRTVTSLLARLGEPDPTRWKLGHWSPEDSAYVDAEEDLEEIERGEGYFLITARPESLAYLGLTAPVEDVEIDLEAGPEDRPAWNQLGNPYTFPIAPADFQVTDGDFEFALLDPQNTLTETSVKLYDPSTQSYVTNPGVIPPLTAFWVRKLAAGAVAVVLPYRAARALPVLPVLGKPAGAAWAVALTMRQGERACEPLVLGAAPVAANAWNPLCLARAPSPPGGAALSLVTPRAEWGRMSGDYVRVLQAPAPTMEWEVIARGLETPGEAVLALDAFDLPPAAVVTVSDPLEGWTRDLGAAREITFAARPERRFRVTVTMSPQPATERVWVDGLRHAYPNPFRGRSGLVFTLARPGAIEVRIHDVAGRRVRDLGVTSDAAGERVLVWDGRDASGNRAAPGVYLAHYRVGGLRGVARMVKID